MAWNIEEAIAYYKKQGAPSDQTALVSLLKEIQQENGGAIPAFTLPRLATGLETKENYLLALIRRIPSLRLADRHVIELCAGPNCGKHTKLLDLAQQLAKVSGGRIEVKTVPCMRMCGKGPNVKWDGVLYHGATEQLLRQLTQKNA
jgi:NADH:ubiquinone oxidoreductase subunit E